MLSQLKIPFAGLPLRDGTSCPRARCAETYPLYMADHDHLPATRWRRLTTGDKVANRGPGTRAAVC